MTYTGQILALDLARVTGFAIGRPTDHAPETGTITFVKEGASMAALFSACRRHLCLLLERYPTIQLIVFEAPLIPSFKRGKTTFETTRRLMGMTAIVEELLYTKTGYDVREATVAEVRRHFLGSNKHKREQAKRLTILKCRALNWHVEDDNAADAAALWDYQATLLRRGP